MSRQLGTLWWRLSLGCSLGVANTLPRGAGSQDRTVEIPALPGTPVRADEYGQGPHAVLLVHGGQFERGSWAPQARVLADAGFRVLAIDLRSVVESHAGRDNPCVMQPECLARDVRAAVEYLRHSGAGRVDAVGASLGGAAVAQASVEGGKGLIDRLILLAPMPISSPQRIRARTLYVVARGDTSGDGTLRLPEIRRQFGRTPPPKRLLVVEGAAHAQHLFSTDTGKGVLGSIIGFLGRPTPVRVGDSSDDQGALTDGTGRSVARLKLTKE